MKKQIKKLIISHCNGIIFEKPDNIIFCKAFGNTTIINFTDKKPCTVPKSLKTIEELLKDVGFFRIHKSYLVRTNKVQNLTKTPVGGTILMDDGTILDVSRRKYTPFFNLFKKKKFV